MSKKKANGEGSISKRADGRYMARYTVNGKRKTFYGATHEEVRRKLNELLNQIANGVYLEPQKDSLEQWLREWLVTYALPTVKQSTYISYEGYVRNHLAPELGDIRLTSVSREQLQRFFNRKAAGRKEKAGLSPKTLKNIYNMLNASLEQAIINDRLIRNPLLGVKLPRVVKEEIRILTPEEQTQLCVAVDAAQDPAAFGILFALHTGLRLGELIGLRWSDLRYAKHAIHVSRTVGRLQKVDEDGNLTKNEAGVKSTEIVIRTPKSITSRREIPLFDELWEDLMQHRHRQQSLCDAISIPFTEDCYLFSNFPDRPYNPRTFEDLFKRI